MEESPASGPSMCPALAHKHDRQLVALVLSGNECQGFHMPDDFSESIVALRSL